MIILAKLFRLIFKFRFLRKYYYGIYSRIFKPLNLFKGLNIITKYDNDLKIKLSLDEWIQQQIYFLDYFDKNGIEFLRKNLRKDSVFFDIGANIGCYSLIAAKLTRDEGKVFSFEPVKNISNRLNYNMKLNNFKNVVIEKKAVFNKSEKLKLFVSGAENQGMSSIFHHDTESGNTEIVDAVILDDYVKSIDLKRLDIIKIDIEGAEYFAIEGMKNTLKSFKPIIIMEISEDVLKNSSVNKSDILELMQSLNYQQKALSEEGETMDMSTNTNNDYKNYAFVYNKDIAKSLLTTD